MLPNTTANLSDGTDNHVYDLREIGKRQSIRQESAAPNDQPATLTISHQDVGAGNSQIRQSLLRFDRVVENEQGLQGVSSAYLVVRNPIKIADTEQVEKTLTELVSFLGTSTYKDQFLAGEI